MSDHNSLIMNDIINTPNDKIHDLAIHLYKTTVDLTASRDRLRVKSTALTTERDTLRGALRLMGDDLYGHIWAQNCHIENGVPSKEELVNRYISKATTQATKPTEEQE